MAEHLEVLEFSAIVIAKLNQKHRLTEDDVRDACTDVVRMYWVDEPRRLYVEGRNAFGKLVIVVLYQAEAPGLWRVATARRKP